MKELTIAITADSPLPPPPKQQNKYNNRMISNKF